MFTTEDETFDQIVAGIEELDLSGFPKKEGRRSIKYGVECESLKMGGYVFAPNPVEAEEIARDFYELDENEELRIYMIREGSVNKYRYSNFENPIHPD